MEGEDRTQSYSRARSSTKKGLKKAKMKSTAQLEVHTYYTSVCWETTQCCIQICWIDGQCDRTFCILFGVRPSAFMSHVRRCVGGRVCTWPLEYTLVWLCSFSVLWTGVKSLAHVRPRGLSVIIPNSGDNTNLFHSHPLSFLLFPYVYTCPFLVCSHTCKHIESLQPAKT